MFYGKNKYLKFMSGIFAKDVKISLTTQISDIFLILRISQDILSNQSPDIKNCDKETIL